MTKRMLDKIKEIEISLSELQGIVPSSAQEYKASLEKKAACERYAEKVVEAVVDLAFLTIKWKRLPLPEDDADAFRILLDSGIIDAALAKKLHNAKGMRNIIAHQYGRIDDEVVFTALSERLEGDVLEYIARIKACLR